MPQTNPRSAQSLARRLGLFDVTMLVMGGIIGTGIFMNPYVVAQRVHTPALVLGAWLAGGCIALMGGFIWAELADRMPTAGGQYAYLRDAYHPLVSFLYGWVLLLVIQTGGMAAVTVTFSRYFLELTGWHAGRMANCLGRPDRAHRNQLHGCARRGNGPKRPDGFENWRHRFAGICRSVPGSCAHYLETRSGPAALWWIVLFLRCCNGPRGLCLWGMAHGHFCLARK